jgi:hypothetical protein
VVDGQKESVGDSPLPWRGRTRLGATSPTGHADGDVRVSIHSAAWGDACREEVVARMGELQSTRPVWGATRVRRSWLREYLNDHGETAPRGGEWSAVQVSRVIGQV